MSSTTTTQRVSDAQVNAVVAEIRRLWPLDYHGSIRVRRDWEYEGDCVILWESGETDWTIHSTFDINEKFATSRYFSYRRIRVEAVNGSVLRVFLEDIRYAF